MKIGKLVLENVTSYEERTEFDFGRAINIFIGPNGGGKSNLQRTIAVILTHYFIHQWQVRQTDEKSLLEQLHPYRKQELARLLGTYGGNERDQNIEIELIPEARDVANIRAIGDNLDEINRSLAYFEKPYREYEPTRFIEALERSPSLRYRIHNRSLVQPQTESVEYGFLRLRSRW